MNFSSTHVRGTIHLLNIRQKCLGHKQRMLNHVLKRIATFCFQTQIVSKDNCSTITLSQNAQRLWWTLSKIPHFQWYLFLDCNLEKWVSILINPSWETSHTSHVKCVWAASSLPQSIPTWCSFSLPVLSLPHAISWPSNVHVREAALVSSSSKVGSPMYNPKIDFMPRLIVSVQYICIRNANVADFRKLNLCMQSRQLHFAQQTPFIRKRVVFLRLDDQHVICLTHFKHTICASLLPIGHTQNTARSHNKDIPTFNVMRCTGAHDAASGFQIHQLTIKSTHYWDVILSHPILSFYHVPSIFLPTRLVISSWRLWTNHNEHFKRQYFFLWGWLHSMYNMQWKHKEIYFKDGCNHVLINENIQSFGIKHVIDPCIFIHTYTQILSDNFMGLFIFGSFCISASLVDSQTDHRQVTALWHSSVEKQMSRLLGRDPDLSYPRMKQQCVQV